MIDFRSARAARSAFDFIQVRIASPEEIRGPKDPKERERIEMQGGATGGPGARSRSPRPSTTARSSRKGRPLLRAHLRSGQGLGVPLREVQAHSLRAA